MKKLGKTADDYAKQFKRMPLDLLLSVINGEHVKDAVETEAGWVEITRPPTFKERLECCKISIRFLHQPLDHLTIEDKSSLEVTDEADLVKRAKELLGDMKKAA